MDVVDKSMINGGYPLVITVSHCSISQIKTY